MKKLGLLVFLICIGMGSSWVISPFRSWDHLMEQSSDIIVMRCIDPNTTNTPPGGPVRAEISVVDVLKGETNRSSTCLDHHARLRQNDYYLVFAIYTNGCYYAIPDYAFVPIAGQYTKERAVGTNLTQKIHALLKSRLDYLKMQIPREQEEQKRLEQAFK